MKSISLILLLFSVLTIEAQNFLSWKFKDRYFSISAGTGTASYFGELNYNNRIKDRLSVISFGIEARLLSKLGARVDANYFVIDGSDSNAPDSSFQRQRNLSFKSRNFQFALHGIYYFKKYQGDYFKRWSMDPYVFTGTIGSNISFLHDGAHILVPSSFVALSTCFQNFPFEKCDFVCDL